jgi:SET domain-containing protein
MPEWYTSDFMSKLPIQTINYPINNPVSCQLSLIVDNPRSSDTNWANSERFDTTGYCPRYITVFGV